MMLLASEKSVSSSHYQIMCPLYGMMSHFSLSPGIFRSNHELDELFGLGTFYSDS